MKIAIGTTGDNPDAWVNSEFGWCPRFVVVDTDSMSYFVVSQPTVESHEEASLAAIRTLAQHDVSTVIVATAQPQCRRVMNELGVDVIEGVEGLTVRQAVERFLSTALYTPGGRKAKVKIAVASDGDDLEAPVGTSFGLCTRFLLVDPDSLDCTVVSVTPKESPEDLSVEAIRAVARGGATVVITPRLQPRCCRVLFQLGMDVVLCGPDISARQAIEMFKEGKLTSATPSAGQVRKGQTT
jgi:predicted Fe-Mo cluster-binding NifX family protein